MLSSSQTPQGEEALPVVQVKLITGTRGEVNSLVIIIFLPLLF
jgi:hypothetical protein